MATFLNNLITNSKGSSFTVPSLNTKTSPLSTITQTKYPQSTVPQAYPQNVTTTPTPFVANPNRTPVNVISANNLNTQPVVTPQVKSSNTAVNNLKSTVSMYSPSIDELTTTPTTATTPAPVSKRDEILGKYLEGIDTLRGKGKETLNLQEEEKLAQKREELARINEKQTRLNKAYEKEVEAIQKNPEGVSEVGLKVRLSDAEKTYLDKKADLAIDRLAAQGDIDTALKIVEDKINAKYAPIEQELNAYKDYISLYSNDLTESEKLQVNQAYEQKVREYQFQKEKEILDYKSSIESRTSGIGGGVSSANVLNRLSPKTYNEVIKEADKFSNSPIVKKYNELVSAGNFINATDPTSTNPASHQALVYNFAKMLDPDSVVREGEYATIAKYSQSLAQKFGGEIRRVTTGSGFLSPSAIEAIQKESQNRINAYKPQYESVKNQFSQRIDNRAGSGIGQTVLLDYEEGYVQPQKVEGEDIFDEVVSKPTGYWSKLWNSILGK